MALFFVMVAYIIGSIPWAVLVVRWLRGIDVRTSGSGNVGARNSLRVGGPVAGIFVLVLDALKGALPTFAATRLFVDPWIATWCAIAVVFGHCFSLYMLPRVLRAPWRGWRMASLRIGGMGLATGLGAIIVLTPLLVLPVLAVGGAIIFGLKRPTLAALVMIFLAAFATWFFNYPQSTIVAVWAMVFIIFIKHLQDIFPAQEELDLSV